mgnify:CR=1 FL=1
MAANKKILVIDVGGSNVKIIATGIEKRIKIPSHLKMSPQEMVDKVVEATKEWDYECISIGCPCAIQDGEIKKEPVNLGKGWIGFDFEKAFGMPTKLLNDAAMQAYGCYKGGKMLFLGLGTGLGTTLIADNVIIPMEGGHLPYLNKRSFEDYTGKAGLKKLGAKKWEKHTRKIIKILRDATVASDLVIGGGNSDLLDPLPKNARRVDNSAAFKGGFRLWD